MNTTPEGKLLKIDQVLHESLATVDGYLDETDNPTRLMGYEFAAKTYSESLGLISRIIRGDQ